MTLIGTLRWESWDEGIGVWALRADNGKSYELRLTTGQFSIKRDGKRVEIEAVVMPNTVSSAPGLGTVLEVSKYRLL